MSRYFEEKKERILSELREKLSWPHCPFHKSEMVQISKLGQTTYYECFEITDELKHCGHKEWSI